MAGKKKLTLEEVAEIGISKHKISTPSTNSLVAITTVSKGGHAVTCPSTVCFHVVRSNDGDFSTSDPKKFIISGVQQPKSLKNFDRDTQIIYLDYIFNRSPFQDVFFSKDPEKCLNDSAMVADCDTPGNLMLCGLIAARELWTTPARLVLFKLLVERGVNEDMALLLVHMARFSKADSKEVSGRGKNPALMVPNYGSVNGKDKSYKTMTLSTRSMGAPAINPFDMAMKDVKRFLEHKPYFLRPNFSQDSNYYGLQLTYIDSGFSGTLSNYDESCAMANKYSQKVTNKFCDRVSSLYKYGLAKSNSVTFIFEKAMSKVMSKTVSHNADHMNLAADKLAEIGKFLYKEVSKL